MADSIKQKEKNWLELGFRNITFTDELDFDISEIESVYKDPSEEA